MENGLEERTNVPGMTNRGTVSIVQRRNGGVKVRHDGGCGNVSKKKISLSPNSVSFYIEEVEGEGPSRMPTNG